MNKSPILTIAIPAYNVELYLEDTISSITSSKYISDIEVIIVNDGSSDHTSEIAEKIALEHNSVKVINKPNGGHGSAINAGLKSATGKYFRLLDGDDWFDTIELDSYIERLKQETSDLVLTDYVECFIKSNTSRPVTFYSNLKEFTTYQIDDIDFQEWGPMLPTTTIKTELLRKLNFHIDEKCYYVDQEYNMACYFCAKTVTYYPSMIYHYRLERDGQSMEKSSLIKNVTSHEKVCARLLAEYQYNFDNLSPKGQAYFKNRVIIPMCHMQYMIATEWCKSKKHFLSFDNTLKKYPSFYNDPGICGTITNFHRKTHGIFIKLTPILQKLSSLKNKVFSHHFSKKNVFIALGFILTIAIANAIIINYVNSEQTVYYWDLSGYWKNSISLIDLLHTEGPISVIKAIIESLSTDYNYLPLVPMLPFLLLFGTSRLAFILITLNLYVIPFALIMTSAVSSLFSQSIHKIKSYSKPLIFSIFVFSTSILIPVINGRPDAICLVVIALIFHLIARTRLECISNYLILGVFTFLLILLRRYFAIWGVCLYIGIFITKTILNFHHFKNKRVFLSKTIKLGLKLLLSGILLLFLMLIVAPSLLNRYLTGGYGDAYSGYLLGDFLDQIMLFIRYYGIIFLTLTLIALFIIYLRHRKSPSSEITTIFLITSLFSFLLFTRIQTLGDQHMYLFAPFFCFLIALLVVFLGQSNNKLIRYTSILPSIIVLSLSIYSFTGIRSTECSNLCYVTGLSEVIRPVYRNDIAKLKELDSFLSTQMKDNDYVYILSSSDVFNDDLLANLNLPTPPKYNISGVKHVDKRDGFPYYFFDATYVIVADPIQTHLQDGSQDVIVYLADSILKGDAKNLELLTSFNLENNVTLNVYHKKTAYQETFLQNTRNYFTQKYYDYPFLYEDIPLRDTNYTLSN